MKTLFKKILNTVPRPILIRMSYLARPVLALFLKGDTYTDPIDGKSFKSFLPYGYGNQRDNVLSPSTLSLERHRLLWLYLKNETNFFDLIIPKATNVSGHISKSHKIILGLRNHLYIIGEMAIKIGLVWCTKTTSYFFLNSAI